MWHKELWLIDHGAALYFHHTWDNWQEQALKPFAQVKEHVLLSQASELEAVNADFRTKLTNAHVRAIVAKIPDEWLIADTYDETAEDRRKVYAGFLETRLANSDTFVKYATDAREALI
jgi:hypothetical protein